VGAYTAHNSPADVVEYAHNSPANVAKYQNLRKTSGEHLDPIDNNLQHVASNSPIVRRVMPDEMETRPKNAFEAVLFTPRYRQRTPTAPQIVK
jgi:hypothetical protein